MAIDPALLAQLPENVRGNVVDIVPAPGGGYVAVGKDGGIFNLGGSKFYGSVPGLQGDSLAGKHQFGAGSLKVNPDGSYSMTDAGGHNYAFGPQAGAAPAANPLYSDPGFLAFLRGSDYTLDASAAAVARKQAALQQGLGNSLMNLKDQGVSDRRNTDNSYEARGVFRSGARDRAQTDLDNQYANREAGLRNDTANQISDLNQSLSDTVAQQQQKAAELGYGTAGQQGLTNSYSDIQKKYPGLFPVATGSPIQPS
jgi:hypothetical protein